MNRKARAIRIVVILGIVTALFGCDRKEDFQNLSGTIVGFVDLCDILGAPVRDRSGVTVTIENTARSVVTKEEGRFELSDINAGTYNLVYEKTGFGASKLSGFQFVGGNVPALVNRKTLYQLPASQNTSLETSYSDGYIFISVTMEEEGLYALRFFVNDSLNVSGARYDFYRDLAPVYPLIHYTCNFQLSETPFNEGDRIYLVAYCRNYLDPGYYDLEKETDIGNYVKASDVMEFTVE